VAAPHCRHFGPCGGCDWQHLLYPEQLEQKREQLASFLRASLGASAPRVEPVIGMRVDQTGWPWQFRHKASYVFGDRASDRGQSRVSSPGHGGQSPDLQIGHFAASSRTVVPIIECPVHAARANHIAFALHAHLARAKVPAAGPALRGVLRHLIVRTSRDGREAVAMLVVTRNDKLLRSPVRAFLETEDAPDGFYLNVHDKPGPYMVGRDTMRLRGRSHIRETVNGVSFLVSPTTFFQTNVEAAEVLLHLVMNAVGDRPSQRILDLYAGSGLFTMPLAARGHQVTSVEESAQAVKDADANIRLNRIPPRNVRLVASRVEDALQRLRHETFDMVVLDPPRQGCSPTVLRGVFTHLRPKTVVYVSCNPETLAGELPSIATQGYRIHRVQPVDMFPHTIHIETVVTLVGGRDFSPAARRG
jgi:23S rRNA (uracil1939-C5)-methyltransferase